MFVFPELSKGDAFTRLAKDVGVDPLVRTVRLGLRYVSQGEVGPDTSRVRSVPGSRGCRVKTDIRDSLNSFRRW